MLTSQVRHVIQRESDDDTEHTKHIRADSVAKFKEDRKKASGRAEGN